MSTSIRVGVILTPQNSGSVYVSVSVYAFRYSIGTDIDTGSGIGGWRLGGWRLEAGKLEAGGGSGNGDGDGNRESETEAETEAEAEAEAWPQ